MSYFRAKTLFSAAIRKRCMLNLNSIRIPATRRIPPSSKGAAVLLPICGIDGQACLFYTVRKIEGRQDTGRVVFPGGFCGRTDTPVNVALKETREDIGLDTKSVEIWGVGPSVPICDNRHLIKPVIGSIANCNPKTFKLNSKKVSEAFTVPIELLCDPKTQFYTQFANGYILPVFVVEQYKIWGMTAFLTHTLLKSLLPKQAYNNEWMRKKITLDHLIKSENQNIFVGNTMLNKVTLEN